MVDRRKRSPHPGVVLLRPEGDHVSWRARYVEPDSGRLVKELLKNDRRAAAALQQLSEKR